MKINFGGRLIVLCGFLFVLNLIFLLGASSTAHAAGDIIISEVAAFEEDNKEWVEIYNRGATQINIENWKFWENAINHGIKLVKGSYVLQPGQYAVFAEDGDAFSGLYTEVANVFDSSWGTLNEAGENIGIKDAQGDIIEEFTYIKAGEKSLQKIDLLKDLYSTDNWVEASSTPGAPYVVEINQAPVETNETEQLAQVEQVQPEQTPTSTIAQPQTQTKKEKSQMDYFFGNVVINELYPAPNKTEKEWIELKNNTNSSVDLNGWVLKVGSGSKIKLKGMLYFYNMLTFDFPKGALKNSGDYIRLLDPTGKIIDSLVYGDYVLGSGADNVAIAKNGQAIARIPGMNAIAENKKEFVISSKATPLEENIIFIENNKIATEDKTKEISGLEKLATTANITMNVEENEQEKNATLVLPQNASTELTIKVLKEDCVVPKLISATTTNSDDKKTRVSGTVVTLPGLVDSRFFYVMSGNSLTQIYSNKKSFPDLEIGDSIEAVGSVSKPGGENRLKTENANDIKIIESGAGVPEVANKPISEIINYKEPIYVATQGVITEKSADKLYIDDGTNELLVVLSNSAKEKTKEFVPGMFVNVVGVFRVAQKTLRIYVASENGINAIIENNNKKAAPGSGIKSKIMAVLTRFVKGLKPGIIYELWARRNL